MAFIGNWNVPTKFLAPITKILFYTFSIWSVWLLCFPCSWGRRAKPKLMLTCQIVLNWDDGEGHASKSWRVSKGVNWVRMVVQREFF